MLKALLMIRSPVFIHILYPRQMYGGDQEAVQDCLTRAHLHVTPWYISSKGGTILTTKDCNSLNTINDLVP